MKVKKIALSLMIGLSLVIGGNSLNAKTTFAATKTIYSDMAFNVSSKKEWKINLSKSIDGSTLTKDNVKIFDDNNNEIDISLKLVDDKSFKVLPPSNGYKLGEAYTLFISNNLKDLKVKPMLNSYKKYFVITDNETFINERDSFDTVMKCFTKGVRPNFSWKTNSLTIREQGGFKEYAWGTPGVGSDIQEKWAAMKKNVDAFDAKYDNNTYADITNMDYYKNMPNLKINFNLANNRAYFTQNSLSFSGEHSVHASKRFVWRTDFEQEFIQEINKRRMDKGLEPLQYDNDLTAMARWGAKRNIFTHEISPYFRCVRYDDTTCLNDIGLDIFDINGVETEHSPYLIGVNHIPQMFEKDMKKIDECGQYQGTGNDRLFNKQLVANPEKRIKEVFPNMQNEPLFLSGGDTILYKPSHFLDMWEKQCKNLYAVPDLEEEFSPEKYPIQDECMNRYKDLNNYLYNPKLKKIGVGAVYYLPITNGDGNGYLKFAMFFSE